MAKLISHEQINGDIEKATLNKKIKAIIRNTETTNHKNLFSLLTFPHPPGWNYNRDYQD